MYKLKSRLVKIQDGGGAILKKNFHHNNRIYGPLPYKFCQWNSIYFGCVSIGLKMRLVKVQDGGGAILKSKNAS